EGAVRSDDGDADQEVAHRAEPGPPRAEGVGSDDAAESRALQPRQGQSAGCTVRTERCLENSQSDSRLDDGDLIRGRVLDDAGEGSRADDGAESFGRLPQLEIRSSPDKGETPAGVRGFPHRVARLLESLRL